MSRRSKGPRLYLRSGRIDRRSGRPLPDVYFIRDGSTEISTGCGPDRLHGPEGAEAQLATYIARKWAPPVSEGGKPSGDPASVYVAEVLTYYAQVKGPKAPDPSAVASRIKALLGFWSDKTLADVRTSSCTAYVTHRTAQVVGSAKTSARKVSVEGARRELEDLSAAIGVWDDEHHLDRRPKVTLPAKKESPRDALTRDQAAALLRAARGWRWEQGKGRWVRLPGSSRANRAHLVRFILIGLYTGTRPGTIPKLLWVESLHQAWVDLDDGVVYRRGKLEREQRTKRRPLVRVPARLLRHLRHWRRLELAAAEKARKKDSDAPPAPASVIHHGGHALAGRIRRGFASCVRDAGLSEEITPHWLRHTCATWLMERGVPLWDAAGFAGMTVATLEKCYGHHRPDHQKVAREALR